MTGDILSNSWMGKNGDNVRSRALFVLLGLALAAAPDATALPGPSPQYPPPPDIEMRVIMLDRAPGGTMEYFGAPFNAKGTLNLGNHADLAGRLTLKRADPTIPNIYIHYQPMYFSGDTTITAPVTYGGQTFDAATPLHSSLRISILDIGLFSDLPFLKSATGGVLDMEIGIDGRYFSFNGNLTGTASGAANTSHTKVVSVPFPMLYLGVGLYPAKFASLNIEVKSFSDGINTMTEWDAEAVIRPIPAFFLAVGYNAQYIKIDIGNFKANLDFKGPYVALGATF